MVLATIFDYINCVLFFQVRTGYPVTEDGKEHGEVDGTGGFSDHGIQLSLRAKTALRKKTDWNIVHVIETKRKHENKQTNIMQLKNFV